MILQIFSNLMVLWFTQHSTFTGAFWTQKLPRAQYCSCGALFYKKNKTYMARGTSEKAQWQKDQLKTAELKAAKLFWLFLFVLTVKKPNKPTVLLYLKLLWLVNKPLSTVLTA